ncbi:hypothetical protein Sjap_022194 [Stephania japonica]|uniref:Uncharacterized protein n=1 Tax=Stephania japonica TaxID=461633 RepID=A0AAP0ERJ5_9MAGN
MLKRHLQEVMNMKATSGLGKYLGIQFNDEQTEKHICNGVVERVNNKVFTRKERFLSPAGKKTIEGRCPSNSKPSYGNISSSKKYHQRINTSNGKVLVG